MAHHSFEFLLVGGTTRLNNQGASIQFLIRDSRELLDDLVHLINLRERLVRSWSTKSRREAYQVELVRRLLESQDLNDNVILKLLLPKVDELVVNKLWVTLVHKGKICEVDTAWGESVVVTSRSLEFLGCR